MGQIPLSIKPDFTDGGPTEDQLGSLRWSVFGKSPDRPKNYGMTYCNWWREEDQKTDQYEVGLDVGHSWIGCTIFEPAPLENFTEEAEQETFDVTARKPKALTSPLEPTQQERELHNLTHVPYRSWCEICVKAKGKETPSRRNLDRQPVIQVDYCFLTTGDGCPTATVLTAVDIQTGFGSAVVTPSKGRDQYSIAELKRFVFEIGRTYGIIQYDPEPSLKALVSETLIELGGMSMRATPRDWKQAHGFVGKFQPNFYGQARAIRLQLPERYNVQISVRHTVYPWIAKHAQFTLNRFLTLMETPHTFDVGKNYSSTVCVSSEKLFCFVILEN